MGKIHAPITGGALCGARHPTTSIDLRRVNCKKCMKALAEIAMRREQEG